MTQGDQDLADLCILKHDSFCLSDSSYSIYICNGMPLCYENFIYIWQKKDNANSYKDMSIVV